MESRQQRGFVPDMIIGTSVGALNGAIAAAHPDRAAPWLNHVWTQLRRLIARAGLPSRIEQLAVPFTAMDLGTGAPVLLDRADLESGLPAGVVVVSTGPESSPPRPVGPRLRAGAIAARAGTLLLRHQIERDPGQYRVDEPSATPAGPGGASTSSVVEAGL